MRDPSRFLPYPELVEPETGASPYRIHDSSKEPWLPSSGVVNQVERALHVPLRADGRSVSLHELAHVRWSPPRLPRVRFPLIILHAVEDARINLGLAGLSMPVRLDPEQRAQVLLLGLQDLKRGAPAAFLLRWVASLGTDAEADLEGAALDHRSRASEIAARLVGRVRERLERARGGADVAPFAAGHAVARELARALRARGALDPAFRQVSVELGCSLSEEAAHGRPAMRGLLGRGGAPAPGEGAGVRAGHMEVVEAPLPLVHRAGRSGLRRSWRPTWEGAQLGSFHRWTVDRAVFRRRIRRRGGSVLVDASGSMRLDASDLDTLLDASGGAGLVAIYSGHDAKGELRVVARGGRRAARDQLHPCGAGNIVDLPALQWLATQPEPRIWVSDGSVTGVGDESDEALTARCRETARAARIRRVPSAEEAAQLLQAGRGRRVG